MNVVRSLQERSRCLCNTQKERKNSCSTTSYWVRHCIVLIWHRGTEICIIGKSSTNLSAEVLYTFRSTALLQFSLDDSDGVRSTVQQSMKTDLTAYWGVHTHAVTPTMSLGLKDKMQPGNYFTYTPREKKLICAVAHNATFLSWKGITDNMA